MGRHTRNMLIPHATTVGGHLFWEASEMRPLGWSAIHLRLGEGPINAWETSSSHGREETLIALIASVY